MALNKNGKTIVPFSSAKLRSLPCCGFFFPCEETGLTSTGFMTDVISGIQHQPSLDGAGGIISNVTPSTTNFSTVYPKGTATLAPLKSGTWPQFGTKYIINFAVANVQDNTTAKIPIGNGSGSSPPALDDCSVSWTSGMHLYAADVNGNAMSTVADTTRLLRNGQDVVIIVRYQPNAFLGVDVFLLTGSYATDAVSSNTITASTSTPGSPSAIVGINPAPYTRVNGLAFYGWAGFQFTSGIPSDWKSACFWMAADWTSKSTNRYLYPGWKGLT